MISGAQSAAEIRQEVLDQASSGLANALEFLKNRIKEALSVPAPRGSFEDSQGRTHIIALTRAEPGAAPRKLKGDYRNSIYSNLISDEEGEVGTNLDIYPASLEFGWWSRAGSWFPVAAPQAAARSKRGRTTKLRPGEVRWQPIVRDKFNAPHPVFFPTLEKNHDNLVTIIGREFEVA